MDIAPVAQPDKARPSAVSANTEQKTSNGAVSVAVRKRKRQDSVTSQEAIVSGTSEDEVMPTATTSRARGAARQTRGVSLKDILIDESKPMAGRKDGGKSTKQAANGTPTGPASSWGYSRIADGQVVWETIDEASLRHLLLANSLTASYRSVQLSPEELVQQAQTRARKAGKSSHSSSTASRARTRPWQVLTAPALLRGCEESLQQQHTRLQTPISVPFENNISTSSTATLPLGSSPQNGETHRLHSHYGVAAERDIRAPVFMAKTESTDSNRFVEVRPRSLSIS